jgi:hypothetical protein
MQTAPSHDSSEIHAVVNACVHQVGLDERASREPEWAEALRGRVSRASEQAWALDGPIEDWTRAPLRLDTQRALYAINRLNLYWCDGPEAYQNERSRLLADFRDLLEAPWQRWLARRMPADELEPSNAEKILRSWAKRDLTPHPTPDDAWIAEEMTADGYRRLLEIVSLNALTEASQLSRALGGAASPAQSMMFRILMEEYGAGRLEKKHSTHFARMLEAQGMSAKPESYFWRVPWEALSAINHAFYLAENKRFYLRFCGAFTYTELSTPVSFARYARAAARLGFSDGHGDYWALHVREDGRHGPWMLEQVALPLLQRFPERRRDLLFGYAQQRSVEAMAGVAVARACRAASEGEYDAHYFRDRFACGHHAHVRGP